MLVERQVRTTLLNDKVKAVKSQGKNMDLMKYVSKVVEYRLSTISKSIWNDWHTIFLTGVVIKTTKYIKYVLVECNPFLKPPRRMKVFW